MSETVPQSAPGNGKYVLLGADRRPYGSSTPGELAEAASWSKPARRMVRSHPDAWVVIDNPAGCAQLARRLAELEDWSPLRTFGTASLDSVDTLVLAGRGVLTGMRGVGGDGVTWRVGDGLLYRDQATGAL